MCNVPSFISKINGLNTAKKKKKQQCMGLYDSLTRKKTAKSMSATITTKSMTVKMIFC